MYKKVLILLFFIPFQLLFAQTSMLKDFPEGSTPEEIGKRLAYRFLTEKHALHVGKWIGYPETFYWNGALRYAYLAKIKNFSIVCKISLNLCLPRRKRCNLL